MAKNIGKLKRLERLARAAMEECDFKTSRIRMRLDAISAIAPRCKGAPAGQRFLACQWSAISKNHEAIVERLLVEYHLESFYFK